MEEMSEFFQIAFSTGDFNKEEAIKLYNRELQNNPKNLSALNNRGFLRLELAKEKNDKDLLEKSKIDLKEAIELLNNEEKYKNYTRPNGIDRNLELAEELKIN
jgi:hypothetical protein